MKTIAKIVCISIALMMFGSSYAANIASLDVVDTNTLHVSMDEVKMGTEEVPGEVKVLKDMSVSFATQDEEDSTLVVLTLDESLEINTEYSLLTVFGADGSIDFETGDTLEGVEIINTESDEEGQSIDSITLVDTNTIEVVYTEDLEGGDFEFKLLSDIEVESIDSVDGDTISVSLGAEIKARKTYILMVLSLQDALSQDVELEEGIYDFTAPERVKKSGGIAEPLEETVEAVVEDNVEELDADEAEVELNAAYIDLESPEESTDLLQADIDEVVEEAVEAEVQAQAEATSQENTVEAVAMAATTTPETGAETWVLIMLTLFINTFYYFSRRKS